MLKSRQFTFLSLFPYSFPVFLGLGLGFLVARGDWLYALGLALLVPLAILFSSRPFVGVILWLVLMPLSSALPNPEMMYWVIHRGLIPFTLCMTIFPYLINPSKMPHFRMNLPDVCIALLAVYVPISLLLSGMEIRQPLIKYIDRMFIPFCMYLIVRLTVTRLVELQSFQWTAFFIASSQSMISFIAQFAPYYLPYAWRPLLQGYAAGSLINPNLFVIALGFCICILFQAAMDQKSGLVRTIFIAMSGVSVIGIFLSMERAAWLAGALILVGLFWLYPKIMLRFLIISAVLLLFLGELFFSKYASRVADRINNQGTIYDRIVVTDAMFQMIQVKPIFGWGYDSLNNHIENYYRQVGDASGNIRFTTSHNTYLTIFTELGLVGFLLYMLPMLWLLVMSFRVWRGILKIEPTRRFMLATLWLATLNIFVISNFIDMRFFPIGLTLWWLNLGLIANILNRQHEIYDKFSTKISWQAHDETISHDNLGLVNG
ncbi:MAG: hypothetical protein CVU46_07090 [Chloroflexi bacterium HGW-Chloroflexi-8]|nr:MAG: hypothetical protein CVU46_07090 [Chloroflexi bacterium HGW-Chloroflexi-8]